MWCKLSVYKVFYAVHNKILDQTKLKAFADDKLNEAKMIISVLIGRKHCGKRRNCFYKGFLLFPQFFQKAFSPDPSKHVIVWEWVNPLPNNKCYLDSSKLKKFANDNFIFDENGRKLLKRVENSVGIGETARYEQFLLFLQCFKKTYTADT